MLKVEDLTKRYGNLQVINKISLDVSLGEILTVIGPSGCGKTTLLRLIAGFERPDGGKILIDNNEVSSPDLMMPPFKRKLSMIFQDLALWPHMTVKEHITFVTGKNGRHTQKEVSRILQKVKLLGVDNRYPNKLSGGEKQRLAIARAVASNPTYLLMDEPLNNLDPILKEELQNMIIMLKKDFKMGIIYVSHNIDEVFILADKVAVMNKGMIVQQGHRSEVFGNSKNEFFKIFLKLKEAGE